MSKAKAKVERIPKEVLEAAAWRLQTKAATAMRDAYLKRLDDWGLTKFQLAERVGRPQALIERIMTPEGNKGLAMIAMIAYACDSEIDFKIVALETLNAVPELSK